MDEFQCIIQSKANDSPDVNLLHQTYSVLLKYNEGTSIEWIFLFQKEVGKKKAVRDPEQVQTIRFENNLLGLDALSSMPTGTKVLPSGPSEAMVPPVKCCLAPVFGKPNPNGFAGCSLCHSFHEVTCWWLFWSEFSESPRPYGPVGHCVSGDFCGGTSLVVIPSLGPTAPQCIL